MRVSGKILGLLAGAATLAAGGGFLLLDRASHGSTKSSGASTAAITAPVLAVVQQTVPVYLDFVGTTEAIRSVVLEAKVTGYLIARQRDDGVDVPKDQLLYQIDPRDYQAMLDQAEAQARRDAAALEYSRLSQYRNATLARDGWVARDTSDQSTSALRQSQATLAADAAAIQAATLNLHYTEIRAPFAGRLGRSLVHEGALINATGTQLNSLVQLDPIYVTFNPTETDLTQLRMSGKDKSIPAEVTLPDDGGKRYEGTLTFLNNTVDRSTGTIVARATVGNPEHSLLPGQFVHVRLHVADQSEALLVPQIALGSSQLGTYVYVAENGKAVQRMVSTGASYGDRVVVTKGVRAGEQVIVGNLQKIAPDAPVQPTLKP
jgi:membrane fusion protein, multidrug efflux system